MSLPHTPLGVADAVLEDRAGDVPGLHDVAVHEPIAGQPFASPEHVVTMALGGSMSSSDIIQLAEFLLARFREEEAAIEEADPALHRRASDRRALAGCQARRAIVTLCSEEGAPAHCRVILTLMALPYADHPDYVELRGAGQDIVGQRQGHGHAAAAFLADSSGAVTSSHRPGGRALEPAGLPVPPGVEPDAVVPTWRHRGLAEAAPLVLPWRAGRR